MNKYKVEYLSVINSTENFCKSISSFNSLLQSYENIKINGNNITFNGTNFEYDVQYGEIQKNTQRFFHIKLKCNRNDDLESFKLLLRSFRVLLTKASDKPPEVLWDDISSELSNKAYPIVHEIENMMRKLITKFMITTIGLTWTKDTVPKEVSDSIKAKNSSQPQNYLYESDFIQLSNFLFKDYSTANSKNLIDKLGKASDITDLDLQELKELVPQSNWERYFAPIVDCKSDYLEKRWKRLYELRCMVAHNKFLGLDDFDNLEKIACEIKEKLTQALDNLDKVHIPEEQKEDVAENIASSMNALYGEFIYRWNILQELLIHLYKLTSIDEDLIFNRNRHPITRNVIRVLGDKNIIPKEYILQIDELNNLRNIIVHHSNTKIDEISLSHFLGVIDALRSEIIQIIEKS